jgi:hypothetical protein
MQFFILIAFLNVSFDYLVGEDQDNEEGLKLNSLNQILVYLDEIHVIGKDLSTKKWLLLLKSG